MESHLAMHDFMEEHQIDTDQLGNCVFRALIDFESPINSTTDITEVTFIRNGYNDGDIKLTESLELLVEDYHLDFSTNRQSYEYCQESGKLIITGKSPKMGGNYRVSLLPA